MCARLWRGESGYLGPRIRGAVVDEAGLALEAVLAILLNMVSLDDGLLALVGDPAQLAPDVRSDYAAMMGVGLTILEKAFDYFQGSPGICVRLTTQYRMPASLIVFPNAMYYGGMLSTAVQDCQRPVLDGVPWVVQARHKDEDDESEGDSAFGNRGPEAAEPSDSELDDEFPCVATPHPHAPQKHEFQFYATLTHVFAKTDDK